MTQKERKLRQEEIRNNLERLRLMIISPNQSSNAELLAFCNLRSRVEEYFQAVAKDDKTESEITVFKYCVWYHWDTESGASVSVIPIDKPHPPEGEEGNGHVKNYVTFHSDLNSVVKFIQNEFPELPQKLISWEL